MFGKKKQEIDPNNLPRHIGIIMDGNGRWAKKRSLPRSFGHKAGAKTFEEIVNFAGDIGIKELTFYAFSTENWKRPKEEVDQIMSLFLDYLNTAKQKLFGKDTKVKIVGDRTVFDEKFTKAIEKLEDDTKDGKTLLVNIAINYGGQQEIVEAVRQVAFLVKNGDLQPEEIDEKKFSSFITLSDPDLIIRPSGEKRLSNFMIWQCAYSEFWFSDVLWPDFKPKHLIEAILDFQKRNRRFGGV